MSKKKVDNDPVTTAEDPYDLLSQFRWKEDMPIWNDFGEHVWLGPCILDGKRIGITDCCFVDDPCPHHTLIGILYKSSLLQFATS